MQINGHQATTDANTRKAELEAEFSAVYTSIRTKKDELKRIEGTIAELDAERQRKDREFSRLQVRNAARVHKICTLVVHTVLAVFNSFL